MREITFKQFRKEEKMSFTRTFGASWQQKALTRYCCMNMDTKKLLPWVLHITITQQFQATEKIQIVPDL